MNKAVPWVLCAILLVATTGIYLYFQREVAAKDAELQAAEARYTALKTETARQVQDANERVLAASAKAVEIATEAGAKIAQQKAEADAKLQAASLPQTPVTVSFRKAVLGSGSVAAIKSIASTSLPISVLIERASVQPRRYEFVLDPGAIHEIGHVEGWAFASGDAIEVLAPNHKPVRSLVP